MSETLIGVVIGGLIASIAPIASLLTESRKWRLDKRLEHLRTERSRIEKHFTETLEQLSRAMANNSYPSQMTSDFMVLMPKSVGDKFNAWMSEKSQDDIKAKHAYLDICLEMKKALSDIDKKIEKLIDA